MLNNIKRMINNLPGRKETVKNSYYTELLETFGRDGCPICSLLEHSVEKYLENLLHEFTMDPVSRREIRNAFGYCGKHTAQLIKVTEKTNQRLSASIVAEDLANSFLKYCRRALKQTGTRGIDSLKKDAGCPICSYYAKHEKLYISEFARGMQKNEFQDKYMENSYICMDHLIKVSRLIKDRSILKKVLEPRIAEIESLDTDLNNFIKKFDHKSGGKITDSEAMAWIRFLDMINRK